MTYTPLWCKSNYSFLEGASHPEELVRRCHQYGLPALALTDRDGVYGAVRAHVEALQVGLHLIIGSKVTADGGSGMVLLAQNREGYANLCRLITAGRLRCAKGESRVSWEEICQHAEGIIGLLGAQSPLNWGERPENPIDKLRESFDDRLYALICRHRVAEEVLLESRLQSSAAQYGLPLVAATEVLYHCRSRRMLQDVLTCIRHTVTLNEAGTRLKPNAEHDIKTVEEFSALFRDDPSLLERTMEVAERCTFSLDEIQYRYPSESLPDGQTSAQWLRHLAFEGARKRYGGSIPTEVASQLDKELGVIEELGYCGYFLTMWEVVEYCRKNGILCQGRGSAANSAVCYCLGITAIDPVCMELLFERFLSRERAEPPDIDLDIEHRRREEVIQHIYRKYGRDRAAMVANFVRYRMKSAVRDVGKALGLPPTELDRMAKLLPYYGGDLSPYIKQAGLNPRNRTHSHLINLAQEIIDFPRHLSIHPGGFLLGSEPVPTIVPVENATMPDRTVIQWDKYDVEDMNLFKMDLLGLGALTQLDYAFRSLKEHRKLDISMASIPANDAELFEMVSTGDTVGVFQIESRAQMAMLPRLKPRCFYDLVIEVSIVRPGPITGGMVHPYLRRRNGEEIVEYPHPDLEPVLKKTLGVPLFQEQVMRLAVVAADYTPGEADQLRRDMAAWRSSGRIDKHEQKFIQRMVNKGIALEFAKRVFDQIRGFGEYGFPESHAASFALIGYCTAWLKCHYPVEFYCSLLNAWPMGFYSPATIIEDGKRHGIQFMPVDVLASQWECILVEEKLSNSDRSKEDQFAIRMGLRFVKGLGEGDWERISRSRKQKLRSLREFIEITGLDEGALAALAESGAFGCFGMERREALWQAFGTKGRRSFERPAVHPSLQLIHSERLPEFSPLNSLESIGWDYSTTGHSTLGHLLEPLRDELASKGLPDARSLAEKPDASRASYAGMVICRQQPGTANGVVFMTLEDESGFVNLVLWEKVFAKYRTLLLTNSFLGVTGKIQSKEGVTHLIVESCWVPELSWEPESVESRDFH